MEDIHFQLTIDTDDYMLIHVADKSYDAAEDDKVVIKVNYVISEGITGPTLNVRSIESIALSYTGVTFGDEEDSRKEIEMGIANGTNGWTVEHTVRRDNENEHPGLSINTIDIDVDKKSAYVEFYF